MFFTNRTTFLSVAGQPETSIANSFAEVGLDAFAIDEWAELVFIAAHALQGELGPNRNFQVLADAANSLFSLLHDANGILFVVLGAGLSSKMMELSFADGSPLESIVSDLVAAATQLHTGLRMGPTAVRAEPSRGELSRVPQTYAEIAAIVLKLLRLMRDLKDHIEADNYVSRPARKPRPADTDFLFHFSLGEKLDAAAG